MNLQHAWSRPVPTLLAAVILVAGLGGCAAFNARSHDEHDAVMVDFYTTEHAGILRTHGEFKAEDGKLLSYSHFQPETGGNGTAVVYLHGIESHGAWFEGPASLLALQNFDVYCLDRRGSGRNQIERGLIPGYAESYRQLLSDIHQFLQTVQEKHERIVLAGSSWGGKLALAYALEYPEDSAIDALILITPGLRAHVDLPVYKKLGVLASLLLNPDAQFDVPIPPDMFTTNVANLALIGSDPLRLHEVTARFFFESLRLDWFIDDKIEHSKLPMLLVLAGQDRVIDNEGVLEVLRQSPAPLEVLNYVEETHAVQLDSPARLATDMARYILGASQVAGKSGRTDRPDA